MAVDTLSRKCAWAKEERDLARTLMKGTKALRMRGTDYTPKYPGEDDDSYKIRLEGTRFYNHFKTVVKRCAGKVLSKDIALQPNVPETIVSLARNIDGQGRNLTAFTLDAFTEAMVDGVSFIYVDFPNMTPSDGSEPKKFLSQQMSMGIRPNAILYTADQILGFTHENRNGVETLTQVRIHECVTEVNDNWEEVSYRQIKVINIGSFQIYRKPEEEDKKTEWRLFDQGTISLNYIPLIPVYTNRESFMIGTPPLQDLAEMNLEHWISSTDQRKALVFARFAMMVFTGVQPGTIKSVGPDQIIELGDPQCQFGKIETSGQGIEAGRLDIEAIEKRMESASMMISVQAPNGDITATATSINSDDSNSSLLAAAGVLEDSLDQVLQACADYMKLGSGGEAKVNKEFARTRPKATVQDYINLRNAQLLDGGTVFTELQRVGYVDESLDYDIIEQKILEETPRLVNGGLGFDGVGNPAADTPPTGVPPTDGAQQ